MNIVADLTPFRCEKPPEEAALATLELIKALKTTPRVRLMLLTADWNDAELRRRIGTDRCVFVNVYGALHKRNPAGGLEVPQDRRRWRRMWLEISYGKPDLLFCPFGVIVYQPSAIPTVCTVQDTRHLAYPQFFDSSELAYRNQLFDDVCRNSAAIVCTSAFTQKLFAAKYPYPKEQVFVAYQPVRSCPDAVGEDRTRQFLEAAGLPGKQFAFYPSGFLPHKNHRLLLMAFAVFCRQNPELDLSLVLTGSALAEAQDLREAMATMGIADRVYAPGPVDDGMRAALYRHCSFVIYPSLYEDAAPEALAALQFGKPLLCSDRAGLPEYAGEAALYFDPRIAGELAAAMQRIMTDDRLSGELQHQGALQAQKFGAAGMARQYAEIFQAVMEK